MVCPFIRYCRHKEKMVMTDGFYVNGCTLAKKEDKRLEELSMEKKECKHDYIYDTTRMLMIFPVKIKGVCIKCGENISLTKKEYEAKIKKGND